ncbi:UvrD-helicase domain-containing protein [Lysobacter sp. Root667]|uniref:UvrD-helicase domain-containing protein n=1 Tax=Lysobacter sp. Root667 TaxID=1736581 RepID=UPI0009E82735|nr:UvrD-helicase domain-containing protein [Lysobacter sp. Root667]
MKNLLIIAAAGSGKTRRLVQEALAVKGERVLITTYTENNEAEIRRKFIEQVGYVPANVTIMTWFTFLIVHGVKPFQGMLFDSQVNGMLLVSGRSGEHPLSRPGRARYWGEKENFTRHYFTPDYRIYSDKLAKLASCCNAKSGEAVFDRISKIFAHVFVDECQDLAGHDLDLIIALFKSSTRVLLVGDPRQTVYVTHNDAKYKRYLDGRIVDFLREKAPKRLGFEVDTESLRTSHRNPVEVCEFSSRLYPGMPKSIPCDCTECRSGADHHSGVFIVRPKDYGAYMEKFSPMQLRDKVTEQNVDIRFPAMNFGQSKGMGFDRVTVLPTRDMAKWIESSSVALKSQTRARFYVALTRARLSVAIRTNWKSDTPPNGMSIYRAEP